jgi:methionyl-tRNA formyltransferase
MPEIIPLRIAFMGTPDFAVPVLEALIRGPHEVVCVYTQPPRHKGRGQGAAFARA